MRFVGNVLSLAADSVFYHTTSRTLTNIVRTSPSSCVRSSNIGTQLPSDSPASYPARPPPRLTSKCTSGCPSSPGHVATTAVTACSLISSCTVWIPPTSQNDTQQVQGRTGRQLEDSHRCASERMPGARAATQPLLRLHTPHSPAPHTAQLSAPSRPLTCTAAHWQISSLLMMNSRSLVDCAQIQPTLRHLRSSGMQGQASRSSVIERLPPPALPANCHLPDHVQQQAACAAGRLCMQAACACIRGAISSLEPTPSVRQAGLPLPPPLCPAPAAGCRRCRSGAARRWRSQTPRASPRPLRWCVWVWVCGQTHE